MKWKKFVFPGQNWELKGRRHVSEVISVHKPVTLLAVSLSQGIIATAL